MAVRAFPPVELANEYGLLALGGDLSVEELLLAYRSGIFPWPIADDAPLTWFSPPERALLFLNDLRISRSLKKVRRRAPWEFRVDTAFEQVIQGCAQAENRSGMTGTWITPDIQRAYLALHRAGYAHSFETWLNGELAGGLYGVSVGGMFAGESMFHRVPNASKLSFWYMTEFLAEKRALWIDCQVLTPFLESFGAVEVPREDFLALLEESLTSEHALFPKR